MYASNASAGGVFYYDVGVVKQSEVVQSQEESPRMTVAYKWMAASFVLRVTTRVRNCFEVIRMVRA